MSDNTGQMRCFISLYGAYFGVLKQVVSFGYQAFNLKKYWMERSYCKQNHVE